MHPSSNPNSSNQGQMMADLKRKDMITGSTSNNTDMRHLHSHSHHSISIESCIGKKMESRKDSGVYLDDLCSRFQHSVHEVVKRDLQLLQSQETIEASIVSAPSFGSDIFFAKAMQIYHTENCKVVDPRGMMDLFEFAASRGHPFAASRGHPFAALNLAILCEEKGQLQKALTLFKQAANAGVGRAAFRVGIYLLSRIDDLDQSMLFTEALDWLRKAVCDGFPLAGQILDWLK